MKIEDCYVKNTPVDQIDLKAHVVCKRGFEICRLERYNSNLQAYELQGVSCGKKCFASRNSNLYVLLKN